ncbi:MAG: TRAP transporter small permease subunit [Hydrogenophaga sp.]|nr:TRAP transporter small permease subunit [Hydrogenophaga sp.]
MKAFRYLGETLLALCLLGMVIAVFSNVVLRYGFNSGLNASEELSRLLFVWMVFLGATLAYPVGQHMAFTSLVGTLRHRPRTFALATFAIRALVLLACVLLGRGAWQQVVVGMGSHSVVLNYPMALLPLPALLSSVAIGCMVLVEMVRRTPLDLGHELEME